MKLLRRLTSCPSLWMGHRCARPRWHEGVHVDGWGMSQFQWPRRRLTQRPLRLRFRCAWCGRWLGPLRGRCPWFVRHPDFMEADNLTRRCEWW